MSIMSIMPRMLLDKHCFIQCPPETCNCINGNRLEWELQQSLKYKSKCELGCVTTCKARVHGCASECPALPWQPTNGAA